MKKLWKYMLCSLLALAIVGSVLICWALYELGQMRIYPTKLHGEIYVEAGDVIDSHAIVNVPEKYELLNNISWEARLRLALYMEENGLKLKTGVQRYVGGNPPLEDMINLPDRSLQFEALKP